MAWKKAAYPPPPKNKIVVETKIIRKGEKPRKVKTLNGKIQEVYNSENGAWEKYDPNSQIKSESLVIPQSTPQKEEQDAEIQPEAAKVEITTEQKDIIPDQQAENKKEEPSDFDKLEKMNDADFKKEIASLPENYFEKMLKTKSFSNTEKGILRSRRIKLREETDEILSVPPSQVLSTTETLTPPTTDIGTLPHSTTDTGTLPQVKTDTGTLPVKTDTGTLPVKTDTGTLPVKTDTGTLPQVIETDTLLQVPTTDALPQVPTTDALPQVPTTASELKQDKLDKSDSTIDSNISKNTEPINLNTEPPVDIQKNQEVQEMPIPGVSNLSDRLNQAIENIKDTDIDTSKTANIEPQKADIPKEVPKAEVSQGKPKAEALKIKSKEKKPIKEAKHTMADDETIQPSDERKFEEWLKKHKFQENVEKMTELAAENQEEIEGISTEITNVKGEIGDVKGEIGGVKGEIGGVKEEIGSVKGDLKGLEDRLQDRLGSMKRPVSEALGEICTGVDCIKGDIKRSQESQQMLESKMNQRFEQLSDKLKSLEEPTFVCDNCGADGIRPLSSFCPNCGSPIHSWSDETGQPVKGWVPYWKRYPEKVA